MDMTLILVHILDTKSATRARNIRSAGVRTIKMSLRLNGILPQQGIVGDAVRVLSPPVWVLNGIPDEVLNEWDCPRCIFIIYTSPPPN